jgi:hypothetical protein
MNANDAKRLVGKIVTWGTGRCRAELISVNVMEYTANIRTVVEDVFDEVTVIPVGTLGTIDVLDLRAVC